MAEELKPLLENLEQAKSMLTIIDGWSPEVAELCREAAEDLSRLEGSLLDLNDIVIKKKKEIEKRMILKSEFEELNKHLAYVLENIPRDFVPKEEQSTPTSTLLAKTSSMPTNPTFSHFLPPVKSRPFEEEEYDEEATDQSFDAAMMRLGMQEAEAASKGGVRRMINLSGVLPLPENVFNKSPAFLMACAPGLATASRAGSSRAVPMIDLISQNEFAKLPKYMRGRLTVDQINSFVDTFNNTLGKKYEIIRRVGSKPSEAKMSDANFCKEWKFQKVDELSGCHFITASDFINLSNFKMAKATNSLFTILRHCKRIREYRTLNPTLVRYVIKVL